MTPTPNLRPQRMVGETVIDAASPHQRTVAVLSVRPIRTLCDAALALEIATESLREQAAETLVVRDAWDRERGARSQRYFEAKSTSNLGGNNEL